MALTNLFSQARYNFIFDVALSLSVVELVYVLFKFAFSLRHIDGVPLEVFCLLALDNGLQFFVEVVDQIVEDVRLLGDLLHVLLKALLGHGFVLLLMLRDHICEVIRDELSERILANKLH